MKTFRKTTAIIIIFLFVLSISTFCSSASDTIISNLKVERIHDLPNVPLDDTDYFQDYEEYLANHPNYHANGTYTNTSGMVIGKSMDSLFVVKSNDSLTRKAIMYFFPNFSTSDRHAVIKIDFAGHANGMAIDTQNVYITASSDTNEADEGITPISDENDNYVLKIPRSVIHDAAYEQFNNPGIEVEIIDADAAEPDASAYTFIKLLTMEGNITTNQGGEYNHKVSRLTLCNGNGNFIVNYHINNNTSRYYKNTTYTKAKITHINGNEVLLLSNSPDDIFMIKNTISDPIENALTGETEPVKYANGNISYSSSCGFYDPKFIQNYYVDGERRTKNVILWADIDSDDFSYTTINNVSYRYFTPTKINLNVKNAVDTTVSSTEKMYNMFEIESIAFDENNDLFFAANVAFTRSDNNQYYDYYNAFKNHYGYYPVGDGVFKLTRYASNDSNQTTPLGWEL